MAIVQPRNRSVIFRVTEEEYNRLETACAQGRARSLSDFARSCALSAAQSGASEVERKLEEIRIAVEKLAGATAKNSGY